MKFLFQKDNPLISIWLGALFTLWVCVVPITATAQTYWLNSFYDEQTEHYPTAEEACLEGELQRRLDG